MKKIVFRHGSNLFNYQFLRKMRLTILLLFAAVLSCLSAESYSQITKLSVAENKSTLLDVIRSIENQSEFNFFYNEKVDVNRIISLEMTDKTIFEVLDKALENTSVKYKVLGRQIALYDKLEMEPFLPEPFQERRISGKVTDKDGTPLPGVSIVIKGTTTGTTTGMDGNFQLQVSSEKDILVFSFIGMETQEITIGALTQINLTMVEAAIGLEEVVVIGYGSQKKGNLTGSVSTVKSEDIVKAPLASTTNALTGRLPGLISLQSSGLPGSDAATLSIRGFGAALIIVDGVESSFNSIDPNQIESVSILKDGSASIYGSRAGNGVILVTTKRGNLDKPTITFNTSQTFQGITSFPKPCNAGQYTEMRSEVWLNEGKPAAQVPFTEEQIQKYYDGSDPLFPNTDWFNTLVRKWAPQQQHNFSVRGGSDKIRYYGFIGYLDQQSMWKNNGGEYKRYNFQSNIDAKIFDNLTLQINVSSIVEKKRFPASSQGIGTSSLWPAYWATLPIYPASFPDPTKNSFAFGNGGGGVHLLTNSEICGYNNTDLQNLYGTAALEYKIKTVKGLSVKALTNYLQNYVANKVFYKPAEYFTYDPASQIYTKVGALTSSASLSQAKGQSYSLTQQYSINYDNTFTGGHHITALALYENIDYNSDELSAARINYMTDAIDYLFAGSSTGMNNNGTASEMGRKSYVGRINYIFRNKYLAETTLRADASAKFASSKRWGYFPGISLGWILTEENFMKSIPIITYLKLRTSYGQSGYDAVGNFQYLAGYNYGQTIILGTGPQQGIVSKGLANPNLTWERISIYNVGFDFSLLKNKIYGEGDVFYRERTGIPANRLTSLPSTFGAALPPENINSQNTRGFEIKLGTSGNNYDFKWIVEGNISWSRSRWDHYEEPLYSDPVQAAIYTNSNRWTDRQYGYISDGLFTSQAEIDALTYTYTIGNSNLRPGCIKYKDLNNDKILDWKDQVEIGKGTTPHWMLGLNTNLMYKNFYLSSLFQGAFGYYSYIQFLTGGTEMSVFPTVVYDLRWTEENNDPDAFIPRLSSPAAAYFTSNNYTSDHWYKKAGYLRLKELTFGYNVPGQWLQKFKLTQLKVYFSGTNLITLDKLKKFGVDPEAPSNNTMYYYPQQKTITLGVSLSF